MYLAELNKIKDIETKEEMELKAKDLSNNGYYVSVEEYKKGIYSIHVFKGYDDLIIN